MSMRILKGNVKYKDRNDIVCTYGIADDGKQYYFMDSSDTKKFANGNRIATTLLVEAVDPMVKASNIGVIDPEGNVVIPFENKSIRPVDDNVIIVENSTPVSESVIEAINLRSDPLSATKLVSTPATIKEKLNQQMGTEGKYLFNDQFSEATICDINGNNLINDERYSFIAMANDKLYFSKNVADSTIGEYSLIPSEVQNNNVESNENQPIDVSETTVDQNVIENAMENAAGAVEASAESNQADVPAVPIVSENDLIQDTPVVPDTPAQEDPTPVYAPPVEEGMQSEAVASGVDAVSTDAVQNDVPPVDALVDTQSPVQGGIIAPGTGVVSQEAIAPEGVNTEDVAAPAEEVASEEAQEEVNTEESTASVDEVASEEVQEEVNTEEAAPVDEVTPEEVQEEVNTEEAAPVDEAAPEEVQEDAKADDFDDIFNNDAKDVEESSVADEAVADNNVEESPVTDVNDNDLTSDSKIGNIFADDPYEGFNTSIKTDKIVDTDDYFGGFNDYSVPTNSFINNDTIMTDVAKSMSELINQNRIQKSLIGQYKGKIDNYEAQMHMMSERYNEQLSKNDSMSSKLRELNSSAGRLEAKNQLLEQKVRELSKVVAAQDKELKVLRPQLEGKQDLVQLLADAKVLLGNNDSYSYDDGTSYYRRAA